MKIALLSYEYPPETGFGGIGSYTYYHARALVRLGHEVRVFAASTRNGAFHSEHDGVQVTRIKREGWLSRTLNSPRAHRCGWGVNRIETAYAMQVALRKACYREDFDVVEFPECGGEGALVGTLMDVPSVVRFHSPARLIMNMYDTPRIDRELTAAIEQIAIAQADVRTSCSRFLADEVASRMGVPRPIHVIPNGIDLELFDRDDGIDVHRKFGIPRDGITVFFANRMERRKGIHLVRDMCFHVMRERADVHFIFAGNDTYGYMKREILPFIKKNKLKSRFHYLGQLAMPDVRAVLKQIDVFLIPSLWENCPYSCIEAMAAGRAIVSSDCGGMPELIQDGATGLLARNDDAQSFVSALDRTLGDRSLRERLGSAARREVEERLRDVVVAERAVSLYKERLKGIA